MNAALVPLSPESNSWSGCSLLTLLSLSELYSGKEMLRHYHSCCSSNRFLQKGRWGKHWTPNLSFSRLTCHLTPVFFSLINHLNYSSKISGRVMWGLTFMSLQCNTGTQALINQQAILRQILNYSDISGYIISIKFGQCISKRSCSWFEYKDIISKREVDVWRSNFKSVEWELQKVQHCIKRQFAIS